MEQMSLFVEHSEEDVNEMQEGHGIDHVIKTVTVVDRRLSYEKDTTQENDVVTEVDTSGKKLSVLTGENEVYPKKSNVVKDESDQTY